MHPSRISQGRVGDAQRQRKAEGARTIEHRPFQCGHVHSVDIRNVIRIQTVRMTHNAKTTLENGARRVPPAFRMRSDDMNLVGQHVRHVQPVNERRRSETKHPRRMFSCERPDKAQGPFVGIQGVPIISSHEHPIDGRDECRRSCFPLQGPARRAVFWCQANALALTFLKTPGKLAFHTCTHQDLLRRRACAEP